MRLVANDSKTNVGGGLSVSRMYSMVSTEYGMSCVTMCHSTFIGTLYRHRQHASCRGWLTSHDEMRR